MLAASDQKRPLVLDTEPPVPYESQALLKLELVCPEFLRSVPVSRSFYPVRRLLMRLGGDDRGDELDFDSLDIDMKVPSSRGAPSFVSIGQTMISMDNEEKERKAPLIEGGQSPESQVESLKTKAI